MNSNTLESFNELKLSLFGIQSRARSKHSLVLGTGGGDVLALDVASGQLKWRISDCHPGGVNAVSSSAKASCIYSGGADGMVCEIDPNSGNLIRKFKASTKAVSFFICFTRCVVLPLITKTRGTVLPPLLQLSGRLQLVTAQINKAAGNETQTRVHEQEIDNESEDEEEEDVEEHFYGENDNNNESDLSSDYGEDKGK
ncbi:unnamed protein product [Brassica oleracea var. botrytis]